MFKIAAERRSRLSVLLTTLAEGQRDHEELARSSAQIETDYHGRFLIELVQNAVDASTAAGLTDANLLIARNDHFVAVLNQGATFNAHGLKALVSLSLSPKRADEAIGNKGLGFKSVFEVATAAEVFCCDPVVGNLGQMPTSRMRLAGGSALDQAGLLEEIEQICEVSPLRSQMLERYVDVQAALREALRVSLRWRYPEEPSESDWRARVKALDLQKRVLSRFQTAIVLHLKPAASAVVDRAFAELMSSAEIQLFLPAVSQIDVRTGEDRVVLARRDHAIPHASPPITRRSLSRRTGGKAESLGEFWLTSAAITGDDLSAAAATLPGPGWRDVRHALVQVALPVPEPESALREDGVYFIGLPTKRSTGSPFRVSAPFHGTLARTSLDLDSNPFNRLLDERARALAAELALGLRDALGRKRNPAATGVTLALAGYGPFANDVRLRLQDEAIVLLDDGTFAVAPAARTVDPSDADLVELVDGGWWRRRGVRRVDEDLEAVARPLLHQLGVPPLSPAEIAAREGGPSPIECLAAELPRTNVVGWRTCLRWLAQRLPSDAHASVVLPVTGERLAAVEEQPFVPLVVGRKGEPSPDDIPAELLASLPFIDGRLLDEDLRRRLVEGQHPLCRVPSGLTLLDDACLDALAAAIDQRDEQRSRALLVTSLGLLKYVAEGVDVDDLDWRVPCVGGWLAADTAYLGDAWSEQPDDNDEPGIVERVYGPEGRCVLPWWGAAADREHARRALLRVGVAVQPRITGSLFESHFFGHNSRANPLSADRLDCVPESVWNGWLASVVAMSIDWGPSTHWSLDDVQWIDGLERRAAAVLLGGWALTQPAKPARLVPNGPRWKHEVAAEQLWAYALRVMNEPFVPTHEACALEGRLARPSELCRPPERDVPPWLPKPAAGMNAQTLAAVGVRALDEMPVAWLLDQLSTYASSLGDEGESSGVVARGLWSLINRRAGKGLPNLTDRPLPLWFQGRVRTMRGGDVDRVVVLNDPYAAEVLGSDLDGRATLDPETADWSALAWALRAALPAASIVLVGDLPLPGEVNGLGEPLQDVLARMDGGRSLAIVRAIIDQPRTGVGNRERNRALDALAAARLQATELPDGAPPVLWRREARTLLVSEFDPGLLMAEIWPVIGSTWREPLKLLGAACSRGQTALRAELRHAGITEADIERAAEAMGLRLTRIPTDGLVVRARGGASQAASLLPPGAVGEPSSSNEVSDGGSGHYGPPRAGDAFRLSASVERSAEDEHARQIGHLGEKFAFRELQKVLPDFDASCWVSTSRRYEGLDGGDDTLGYDFRYVDVDGRFTGRPGVTCLIDVKANAGPLSERFSLSTHEWRVACACHDSTDHVYVLLRVYDIAGALPAIGGKHVDPVALAQQDALGLTP